MKATTENPISDKKIGYNLLRWFVNLHLRTNYNFNVIDAYKADNARPTLFVGNHSNSAVDPLMVLFSLQRKVHFIARGDVFKGWRAKLFDYFNMIPIFRKEEGTENMIKNAESFAAIFSKLNQCTAVTIYSEGNCLQVAHVRKFRKGTARICAEFEMINATSIPLQIQPVGISYYCWDKFRSDVYVHYADAFTLNDIDFSAANTNAERIHIFNAHVEHALQKVVLQIPELLQPTQFILDEIISILPAYDSSIMNSYTRRQLVSQTLLALTPEQLMPMVKELNHYAHALHQHRLKHSNTLVVSTKNTVQNILLLLVTLPVFCIGVVLNALPFFVPARIAKTKIKVVEFKASVRIILAFFISVIYFLALSIVATILFHWVVGILMFPVSYCLGMLAYEWYTLYAKIAGRWRWLLLVKQHKAATITLYKNSALQAITVYFK